MKTCVACHRLFPDDGGFCPVDGTQLVSTASTEAPSDKEDQRVGASFCAGRYQLWRRVADGGMGRVYQALDTREGRGVALKILHPDVAQDAVQVERFKREFICSAALPHDYIVDVLAFERTEDGSFALVMEYLEGEELRTLLKREKVIRPERLIRMMAQSAIGLQAAHDRKVVHRDLKPDNIFLCGAREGDQTKILDFGSVRDNSAGAKKLTVMGTTIGSPFYMSPEQAQALPELDHRADVWSMAAIAYECLTGVLPFAATTGPGHPARHPLQRSPPPERGRQGARRAPHARSRHRGVPRQERRHPHPHHGRARQSHRPRLRPRRLPPRLGAHPAGRARRPHPGRRSPRWSSATSPSTTLRPRAASLSAMDDAFKAGSAGGPARGRRHQGQPDHGASPRRPARPGGSSPRSRACCSSARSLGFLVVEVVSGRLPAPPASRGEPERGRVISHSMNTKLPMAGELFLLAGVGVGAGRPGAGLQQERGGPLARHGRGRPVRRREPQGRRQGRQRHVHWPRSRRRAPTSPAREGAVDVSSRPRAATTSTRSTPTSSSVGDPAPDGVTFPKPLLARADGTFEEKKGSFNVPFVAAKAGKVTVGGTLYLSVCSEANCIIDKVPLEVPVDVK